MHGAYKAYTLTPEELELARMDRFKEIPAANQREHEVVLPVREEVKTESKPKGKYEHLTKEFWMSEVGKGKTNYQVGIENGVPKGSIYHLIAKLGITARDQGIKKKPSERKS